MKWKEILDAPVPACPKGKKGKSKNRITAQTTAHYLVLDLWKEGRYRCRHAMDMETGEPGTYYPESGQKTGESFNSAAGERCWYWGSDPNEKDWDLQQGDKETIMGATRESYSPGALSRIQRMEEAYGRNRRERAQEGRQRRLDALMAQCPRPSGAVADWITAQAAGDRHYAFYNKAGHTYHCTACDRDFTRKDTGEKKIRDKDGIKCPLCGSSITVEKRRRNVTVRTRLYMVHNIDEKRGVLRYFEVLVKWARTRKLYLEEHIRLMMQRGMKHACVIYYADGWGDWSKGNRANRRWKPGYLYPDTDAVRAGLCGTGYGIWADVFPYLAAAGIKANYNGLLCESNHYWTGIAEYLAKGRFYRLLEEESDMITPWNGYYGSTLDVMGADVGEVLKIRDKQLINRLRENNGGRLMLTWLQWSDTEKKKVSAECMEWCEKANLTAREYKDSKAAKYLNPQQLMNYMKRQCAESYRGRTVGAVLGQYEDYLDMAEGLGKRMDDEMVYRPRDLKRRHDGAVEEYDRRREEMRRKMDKEAAEREAQRMREKYPGYEGLLAEIREKYEYASGDYLICVPGDFSQITAEGMALHHCVGNTERYFDRIVSRETYICFLRKASAPEEPFYTIEVEPGGTIRQHRGAYDEEPDIEQIKPFLREWQKAIRARMGRENHEYAKRSEELRRQNIKELEEKQNTRVLNGLMEDLMEAI